MNKRTIGKIISVIIALSVWQVVSVVVDMEILLASPIDVIKRLAVLVTEDGFLSTVLFSLGRMASGFGLAFAVGIICAVLASRFKAVEILFWPYVVTIKSVPVASFIIICLIWLTYSQLTVFISFLIAFPVIYMNTLQGINGVDTRMTEMAKLYNIPWSRRLLYIGVPAVKPYIISAAKIGVGMAWKAGVAAEVIGTVKGSIGEKLYDAKIYLQNADLLAWTVLIVILSVAMEKLFVFLLKGFFAGVERL